MRLSLKQTSWFKERSLGEIGIALPTHHDFRTHINGILNQRFHLAHLESQIIPITNIGQLQSLWNEEIRQGNEDIYTHIYT